MKTCLDKLFSVFAKFLKIPIRDLYFLIVVVLLWIIFFIIGDVTSKTIEAVYWLCIPILFVLKKSLNRRVLLYFSLFFILLIILTYLFNFPSYSENFALRMYVSVVFFVGLEFLSKLFKKS